MAVRLELPNGDVIEPGEVILFEGYAYRYVRTPDAEHAFKLVPIHWGESMLDLPFDSADALADRWGPESRGALSASEWEDWLAEARRDPQFDAEELDAIADAVLERPGIVGRLRRRLGL